VPRRAAGRAIAIRLFGAAATLLLVAGGAPGSAAPARAGGRIVIGVRSDVTSLNIYTATNSFSQEVADLLYLKLAWEQDDFREGPPTFRSALAASWTVSADRREITFRLDPKTRWSDGRPVRAEDVVFSHRAATSPEVAWVGRDVKEHVSQVSAPDPHTVVYRFSRQYPYALMDAVEGNILPSHQLASIPLAEWPRRPFLEAPVTSGPFVLKRYERGSRIELARNPGYRLEPRPRLDTVIFRILPDETTLLNELTTGGIDVMENVPPDAVSRVEGSARLRVVRVPDLSYTFVCWNVSRPLFRDPRVRRALTLATDREAIVEGLLRGSGRVSSGPVLSFLWAHDRETPPLPFDPAAARALLAEAGWKDDDGDGVLDREGVAFRFELETIQGSSLRTGAVEMLAEQLRRIGVEAVPRLLEFGAFVERHERHQFDAFLGTWRESTKVDLKSAFHSASREGGYNYGGYANTALDGLIDRARAESDPVKARSLWVRAQRLVAEDQPYTFLFERDRFHALPRGLTGVRPSPRSLYAGLAEWGWEPPGEPDK
jgi:peptide/nickel transport system substrate-binding protein